MSDQIATAPLVSIFIVSYNQKDFILETLDSAFDQDYPNFEVVISDDASTDGTAEIIAGYRISDPRFIKIFNKTNLGITKNCNVCLKSCKGKYIVFLGGDDLFLPGKVSAQIKWFEEDDQRVICGHDCEIFDDSTGGVISIDIPYRKEGYNISSWIKDGMIISAQSLAVRSSAIPSFGFDQRTAFVADWKFCLDILLKGGECGYIPGVYSKYRKHETNITKSSTKYMTESYKQSLLDQLYTLSYIEAFYPEYSFACTVRRKKLFYARLHSAFTNKDYIRCILLLKCLTVTFFSMISKRLVYKKIMILLKSINYPKNFDS
jgi:glycosyltransferase involved in cell wall biosynthesis